MYLVCCVYDHMALRCPLRCTACVTTHEYEYLLCGVVVEPLNLYISRSINRIGTDTVVLDVGG